MKLSFFRKLAFGTSILVAGSTVITRVAAQAGPLDPQEKNLTLLECFNGSKNCSLQPQAGIGLFITYFNMVWPWVLGIAAGVGVLQALMGAQDIMMSGNDASKREAGKTKILWAIAGLIMVALAGTILRTINPNFFV